MYYSDYGNYDNRAGKFKIDFPSAQNANYQRKIDTVNVDTTPILTFNKSVDAPSSDALGVYGKASVNMGQKSLVFDDALKVSDNDMTIIGRYVTPGQQARVSEDILRHFA